METEINGITSSETPSVSSAMDVAEAVTVTQSKYYSPAFNAAIFDGPLRIYFAQYQESEALKIYFYMQERLNGPEKDLKARMKSAGATAFIMLYPTGEIFSQSFGETGDASQLATGRLGQDLVIGINGALDEGGYHQLITPIQNSF